MKTDTQPCIPMLKALADETRWRIVSQLLLQPATVSDLTERLKVSQYNISKHLKILRQAGIVEARRNGRHVHCAVAESFRKRLRQNQRVLDLGCCTFRFTPLAR
ncbi:MAG: metalloregulator ArsR/SmtB family transcription factor [Verrucomicrobiota bacterium]